MRTRETERDRGSAQEEEAAHNLALLESLLLVLVPLLQFYLPALHKQFCKSQFPHKSVNSFFILVIIKDTVAYLWGC